VIVQVLYLYVNSSVLMATPKSGYQALPEPTSSSPEV